MRQSRQVWALSLALVVLALELGAQHALAGKDEIAPGKTKAAAKPKVPKIKRTIRVKEAVPAPQVVAPAAPAAVAAEPTGQKNVEMKNEGSTNKVDVQPNISITVPSPPDQPLQIVPQQVKQVVEPIVEEPDDDDETAQVGSGNENKLALVNSNNSQELATLGSNNRHAHTMGNSNNQLVELAEGNGNLKQTVMRNSGNTEQVHIDGVGNHKVTRISNAGNTEALEQQQQVARPHMVSAAAPTLQTIVPTGNAPLVQINMNDLLDRVRSPVASGEKQATTLVQPVVYGLPQLTAPGPAQAPLVSNVPYEALSARQQQAAEIASSSTGLMSPSSIGRQVAPSPYNFWSALQQQQQLQQPMVMVMPPQQQQLLPSPYGPSPMMMMPMFYPYQTPMVMAPQVPFDDYHRDHQVRRLDRKLHKLRIEDKIRRAERRARRKARREHKAEEKEERKTTPKPNVIIVNTAEHHKQAPSTIPAPVVTTPAPKVVVVTKEVTKEPAKKVAVVKEEEEEEPKEEGEDEEEEEVIEWETVRVPKRRMKSKKGGASKSTK